MTAYSDQWSVVPFAVLERFNFRIARCRIGRIVSHEKTTLTGTASRARFYSLWRLL